MYWSGGFRSDTAEGKGRALEGDGERKSLCQFIEPYKRGLIISICCHIIRTNLRFILVNFFFPRSFRYFF
jgi:hypothetical protein